MLIGLDDAGVQHAQQALRRGEPLCLPPPSPITYGIAGTDPGRINRAKGRPAEQPTAVGITAVDQLADCLAVDGPTVELLEWLVFHELLTVLVPVVADAADWLAPATVDGTALVAGAWLPQTLPIVRSVEHLYLSSGNRTGEEPSGTAAGAHALFGDQMLVVDGDHLRTPADRYGATTTVQVRDAAGTLALTRDGVQNAAFAGGPEAYLDSVLRRFRER